ncbi:MAG TPA: hypothetical protein VMJ93_09850 [Verrucomicrobiae bacterium]|nr:hypothetical protein [Verrucomicrobiae bacterium]
MDLKKQRKMVGATQFDIAKEANVLYSRIVCAETGRRSLRRDEIGRIKSVIRKRAAKAMDAVSL